MNGGEGILMNDIDDWNAHWWAEQDLDERWMSEQLKETEVPKTSEMIQSKFLKQADIEEDMAVTIKGVKLEEVGQGEERWILYFRELPKGLVLNITTIRVLESSYGDDSDSWTGKRALIYVDPNVSFQGRITGGLRLRIPKPKSPQEPKPKTVVEQADEEEFDDKIPF